LQPEINNKVMSRINDFETKLDELIKEFSDVPNEDLADSLEYYSVICSNKGRKEN
jgi:predicted house-cleaning noncanonical NTP pyrophosphatase (MazG superfamily)